MSLKWLVGGEINHKFISKQQRRVINQEEERFGITLKGWKKSQNPIEVKIKNLIEYYKDEPDYPRRFLAHFSDLIPPELNPFIKQPATDLQLQHENLKLKNELAEKELKLKELELKLANQNQQTQ